MMSNNYVEFERLVLFVDQTPERTAGFINTADKIIWDFIESMVPPTSRKQLMKLAIGLFHLWETVESLAYSTFVKHRVEAYDLASSTKEYLERHFAASVMVPPILDRVLRKLPVEARAALVESNLLSSCLTSSIMTRDAFKRRALHVMLTNGDRNDLPLFSSNKEIF